jgi:hypothetical protein
MQQRAVTFGIATAIVWWLLLTLLLLNMRDAQSAIALMFAPLQGLFVGALVSIAAIARDGTTSWRLRLTVWAMTGLLFLLYLGWLVSEWALWQAALALMVRTAPARGA